MKKGVLICKLEVSIFTELSLSGRKQFQVYKISKKFKFDIIQT